MRIAIDKNCINKITQQKDFEYIYIFKNETLQDLLKLNLHCINIDYLDKTDVEIDINLTKYEINCIKKANINDKDWYKLPKVKENKLRAKIL